MPAVVFSVSVLVWVTGEGDRRVDASVHRIGSSGARKRRSDAALGLRSPQTAQRSLRVRKRRPSGASSENPEPRPGTASMSS